MAAGAAVLAAAALLSGCSNSAKQTEAGAPSMSAATLQSDLTARLTKQGDAPKSVNCTGELAGQVGAVATCAVMTSADSAVDAVLNVTAVNGDTVEYDVAPRLSRDQLEQAVKAMTSADSVACDSGVEGKTGQIADCTITKGGTVAQNIVAVNNVDGLKVDLAVN